MSVSDTVTVSDTDSLCVDIFANVLLVYAYSSIDWATGLSTLLVSIDQ